MAAKTLGGWVVVNHGMRSWWHVQRLLVAWGVASMSLGRRPSQNEVIDGSGLSVSTYMRDLEFFRRVFPGREPFDLWMQLYEAREVRRGTPADVVFGARWSA
jgi:hypothetical protein